MSSEKLQKPQQYFTSARKAYKTKNVQDEYLRIFSFFSYFILIINYE